MFEDEILESCDLSVDLAILDRLAKWFHSMDLSSELFADCLEYLANGNSTMTFGKSYARQNKK